MDRGCNSASRTRSLSVEPRMHVEHLSQGFRDLNLRQSDSRDEHDGYSTRQRDRGGFQRGNNRGAARENNRGAARGNNRGAARENNRGAARENNRGAARENHGRPQSSRPISYSTLKRWVVIENSAELLLQMCNENEALSNLLQEPMKKDMYELLVESYGIALLAEHQTHALNQILTTIVKSHFFDQCLVEFLQKQKSVGNHWPNAEGFFKTIFKIITEISRKLPEHSICCTIALSLIKAVVQSTQAAWANDELSDKIQQLTEDVERGKRNFETQFRKKAIPSNDSDSPPENFRDLSIIPSASDLIKDAQPFVRAVISKGRYKDEDHYMDVQFRLMREDFIQPLRQGIHDFRQNGNKKNYRSTDLRIYYDVHIIGMTCVNGINHVLQFDVTSLKNVKWEHSKRFLNGSLLCLSMDNFDTVFFATVAFRTPDTLKKGIINVEFKSGFEVVFSSSSTQTFIMAETSAFFESYLPVLEGLQEMSKDVPMKRYFIFCEQYLKPPKYLLGGVHKYDLSSLMKVKTPISVSVLNTSSWPHADQLTLNPSQREAVQLALTKELALIQGPPGTGKTYVGLKVMKVLLQNQETIRKSEDERDSPILVVCYTNHALDQFLEGILEFCSEGIVRVGGRSSSELMEKFNLKNVQKKMPLGSSVKKALWENRMQIKDLSDKIEDGRKAIESLMVDIEREKVLQQHMLPTHFEQLQAGPVLGFHTQAKSKTRIWLNAPKSSLKDCLPQMIKRHFSKLVLKCPVPKCMPQYPSECPSVVDRACTYQGWLQGCKRYFAWNDQLLNDSERHILMDYDLMRFIPNTFVMYLNQMMKNCDGKIETWVLGLSKSLEVQLDEIEALTQFLQGQESGDDFDDDTGATFSQNARIVDAEPTEEEEHLKATLKVKGEGSYLLTRVKMLGIDEDMDENEDAAKDSWHVVRHKKPLNFSKIKQFLNKIQPMTDEDEQSIDNLWDMDEKKRFALYNLWVKRHREEILGKMKLFVDCYRRATESKREIRMEQDLKALRESKVIGMTTTGAAKKRALLQTIGCRIIIVEEAAEVLEAHIITALNKHCQHLILIGDHQQLKPNPTVYTLAKDYKLDLSLFERLVINGIPHVTLGEQHRMRESISRIMRHIYPNLQDHHSVKDYPNVRGLSKNIFFINHCEEESHVSDSLSKSNDYEAEYLVALLDYLLLQGYQPSQITILATYVGQVLVLKKKMRSKKTRDGVRATSVDNYQGEENDIILLSLVRSNDKNNVGFLKVDNRVCVALSRAKMGLYITGNFELLASQSHLWKNIVETAQNDEIIGESLPVACPNHPTVKQEIRLPDDFKNCPEGGCGKPCQFRLGCGHTCDLLCHGYDPEHKKVKCKKRCAKKCHENHQCRKICGQKCGECTELMEKEIPCCGHTDKVACYLPVSSAVCSQKCPEILDCEHQCLGKCGQCRKEGKHPPCVVPIEYVWPCEHVCRVPCYKKPTEYPCPKACQTSLNCGHKCKGTCSSCFNGVIHEACTQKCSKILSCGHHCTHACGVPCLPCSKPCRNQCRHSRCSNDHTCGDKCIQCQEKCTVKCHHQGCVKKCHEMCDIVSCEKMCTKKVEKCQHICSGLCGELCVCSCSSRVISIKMSGEEKGNSSEASTNNANGQTKAESTRMKTTPLLFKLPDCGHIFTVDELDEYIHSVKESRQVGFLPCPQCREPIQRCSRYGNIIKQMAAKREEEKEKIQKLNRVTSDQLRDLGKSQLILFDKDLDLNWSELRKLDGKTLSTNHEVVSVSLKLKFAYLLCDIESLGQNIHLLDWQSEVQSRMKIVKNLGVSLTDQQKSELKLDLERLLLLTYMTKLQEFISEEGGSLPDGHLITALKRACKQLKQVTPHPDAISTAWEIAELEQKVLHSSSRGSMQAKIITIKEMVDRLQRILKSKEEKMLNVVLNPVASRLNALYHHLR